MCLAVLAVTGAGLLPTAHADTDPPPCPPAMSLVCQLLPVAPNWEGDVDLTKNQPPRDPAVPLPEERKPADYCSSGCV